MSLPGHARARFGFALAVSIIAHLALLALPRAPGGSTGAPAAMRVDAQIALTPRPELVPIEPRVRVPPRSADPVPPGRGPPAASTPPPPARSAFPDTSDIHSVDQYRVALAFVARRLRAAPAPDVAGRVEVALLIAASGLLREARVARTSGDARTDAAAIALLVDAQANAPTPLALLGREFSIVVTVEY